MSFLDAAAILANEPWCMSLDAIGELTPFQAREIVMARRDEKGRVLPRHTPQENPTDPYDEWRWLQWTRGIEDWRVEKELRANRPREQ